jgi:hypothetical protein
VQDLFLKQQQATLLTYAFALCSDNPTERLIGERGVFELMQELDEHTVNLALQFYASLKSKAEAFTQGGD